MRQEIVAEMYTIGVISSTSCRPFKVPPCFLSSIYITTSVLQLISDGTRTAFVAHPPECSTTSSDELFERS